MEIIIAVILVVAFVALAILLMGVVLYGFLKESIVGDLTDEELRQIMVSDSSDELGRLY